MATFNDELRRLAAALPPHIKDSSDYDRILSRWADSNPGYFLNRITSMECAELLGITPGALRNRRLSKIGPPGYIEPPNGKGSGHYVNRLVILQWIAEQTEEVAA